MQTVEKDLYELTKEVFSFRYDFIEDPEIIRGGSGKKWKFDALVQNGENGMFGLFLRDWDREIAVTQLRQLYKACKDIPDIIGGIMVCNLVTDFSKDYCEQFGIQLFSRGNLIAKLRQRTQHI